MLGIVEGRSSPDAQRRYADAANNLLLVAPEEVLRVRDTLLVANSYQAAPLAREEHDRLLNALLRTMRQDIHAKARMSEGYRFFLQAPPPEPPRGVS